jgi:hypothetical protein
MSDRPWLRSLARTAQAALRGPRTRRRQPLTRRTPSLEILEDRTLPASPTNLDLLSVSGASAILSNSGAAGGVSQPKSSYDGRFVVYTSTAPNLVPNQVNQSPGNNVFLYDRLADTTTLVSHVPGSLTTAADGPSSFARISGDGHYVVYTSQATDLVSGQRGPLVPDNVFLYDRLTGANRLVTHTASALTTSANDLSTTQSTSGFGFTNNIGRYLLFESYATDLVTVRTTPGVNNLFLYDTTAGTTTLVSHAYTSLTADQNDDVLTADISESGNSIAFDSLATNLVAGQVPNGQSPDDYKLNVFLYDRISGTVTLVTRSYGHTYGTSSTSSCQPVISASGEYIAYLSDAGDLVRNQQTDPPESDNTVNVFLYDRQAGTNRLVSGRYGSANVTSDADAWVAAISRDGSRIAYVSDATNLVAGQGTNSGNVFLYNDGSGRTTIVSHVSNNTSVAAGGVVTISGADYTDLSLSLDGRYVAYHSTARSLVGGTGFGPRNVFRYDATTAANKLVSGANGSATAPGNLQSPAARLSGDGSSVAFLSLATNLDPTYLKADGSTDLFLVNFNQVGSAPRLASHRPVASLSSPVLATSVVTSTSRDGRYTVFLSNSPKVVPGQNDTNFDQDVFLRDQVTGTTTLVSHVPGSPTTTGDAGSPRTAGGAVDFGAAAVVSQDGNWVAFVSQASNLVPHQGGYDDVNDVFLWSRATGQVTLVSHNFQSATTTGNDDSFSPVISADGRYVAFVSYADDLAPGVEVSDIKTNVYVYDRDRGSVTLLSGYRSGSTTVLGKADSLSPSISDDGHFIAFQSRATNLVPGQTASPVNKIYVAEQGDQAVPGVRLTLVSHAPNSSAAANGASTSPVISPDSNYIAFVSAATNLVAGQQTTGGFTNLFLYDRRAGTNRLVSGVSGSATVSASGYSDSPAINQDGTYVAFRSTAPNVVAGQQTPVGWSNSSNIFLFTR